MKLLLKAPGGTFLQIQTDIYRHIYRFIQEVLCSFLFILQTLEDASAGPSSDDNEIQVQ